MNSSYTGVDNLEVMEKAYNYNAFLVKSILTAAPEGVSKALDFGAGAGTFSRMVRDAGLSVTCVEIDESLNERLCAQGFQTKRTFQPEDRGVWDYIYSLNVLEHIENDKSALQSIFDSLTPGGVAYIYVPAFQTLYSSMDKKVGHFRRYHRAELTSLCKEVGFKINSAKYVDSLGYLAALLYKYRGNEDGLISLPMLILFDRLIFPISRILDIFTYRFFGKNLAIKLIKPH